MTPLPKLGSIFSRPDRTRNTWLDLIGVLCWWQLFFCGNDRAQKREIDISELSVKVAEFQRGRAQLAEKISEAVLLAVLELDTAKGEFQTSGGVTAGGSKPDSR